jgi:GNAT superfamily N-acetyltransferase
MDVTLEILEAPDDALDLAAAIDDYARETTAEFRDEDPAEGVGLRLVKRHFTVPECVFLVARDKARGERIGMCVTAPLEDPLLGERMPTVVVLFVHPDYRHRGLASQMVQAVRAELESRGLASLAARAAHNDDALISMGERWGFVRVYEIMVRERD